MLAVICGNKTGKLYSCVQNLWKIEKKWADYACYTK